MNKSQKMVIPLHRTFVLANKSVWGCYCGVSGSLKTEPQAKQKVLDVFLYFDVLAAIFADHVFVVM